MIKKIFNRGKSPLLQIIICLAMIMSAAEVYANTDFSAGLTPYLPLSIPEMNFSSDEYRLTYSANGSIATENDYQALFYIWGGEIKYTSAFTDTAGYSIALGYEKNNTDQLICDDDLEEYYDNNNFDEYEAANCFTSIPLSFSVALRLFGSSDDSSGILFSGITLAYISGDSFDIIQDSYFGGDKLSVDISSALAYSLNIGLKGRQLFDQYNSVNAFAALTFTGTTAEVTEELTDEATTVVTQNSYSMESVIALVVGCDFQFSSFNIGLMVGALSSSGGHEIELKMSLTF